MVDAAAMKRSIGAEQATVPIILTNPDQLSAFIRANPDTPRVIRGAIERLPAFFPGDSVDISVETDPITELPRRSPFSRRRWFLKQFHPACIRHEGAAPACGEVEDGSSRHHSDADVAG